MKQSAILFLLLTGLAGFAQPSRLSVQMAQGEIISGIRKIKGLPDGRYKLFLAGARNMEVDAAQLLRVYEDPEVPLRRLNPLIHALVKFNDKLDYTKRIWYAYTGLASSEYPFLLGAGVRILPGLYTGLSYTSELYRITLPRQLMGELLYKVPLRAIRYQPGVYAKGGYGGPLISTPTLRGGPVFESGLSLFMHTRTAFHWQFRLAYQYQNNWQARSLSCGPSYGTLVVNPCPPQFNTWFPLITEGRYHTHSLQFQLILGL